MYALVFSDSIFEFDRISFFQFIYKVDFDTSKYTRAIYIEDLLNYYFQHSDKKYTYEPYATFLLRICNDYLNSH